MSSFNFMTILTRINKYRLVIGCLFTKYNSNNTKTVHIFLNYFEPHIHIWLCTQSISLS